MTRSSSTSISGKAIFSLILFRFGSSEDIEKSRGRYL